MSHPDQDMLHCRGNEHNDRYRKVNWMFLVQVNTQQGGKNNWTHTADFNYTIGIWYGKRMYGDGDLHTEFKLIPDLLGLTSGFTLLLSLTQRAHFENQWFVIIVIINLSYFVARVLFWSSKKTWNLSSWVWPKNWPAIVLSNLEQWKKDH